MHIFECKITKAFLGLEIIWRVVEAKPMHQNKSVFLNCRWKDGRKNMKKNVNWHGNFWTNNFQIQKIKLHRHQKSRNICEQKHICQESKLSSWYWFPMNKALIFYLNLYLQALTKKPPQNNALGRIKYQEVTKGSYWLEQSLSTIHQPCIIYNDYSVHLRPEIKDAVWKKLIFL